MKHDNHVEKLLSRYIEGQLSPDLYDSVTDHIARCGACRQKLAHHRQIASELRDLLHQAVPDLAQVSRWKEAETFSSGYSENRWLEPLLAPVLISVILATGLMATGVSSVRAAGSTITITAPALNTALAPVDETQSGVIVADSPSAVTISPPQNPSDTVNATPLPAAPTPSSVP